jgi:hypothetical protein
LAEFRFWPRGQVLQSFESSEPTAEYCADGHDKHEVRFFGAYLPPGQVLHAVLLDFHLPAAQSAHPPPVDAPNRPDGQDLQSLEASENGGDHLPRPHNEQIVAELFQRFERQAVHCLVLTEYE